MIFILAHFLLKLGSVHTLCKSGNLKEVVFMNNSAALSQFAVNLKYEDIPAEVIEMAKKMAIQTIGAALASKEMDFTQSVLDFSKKYSSGPADATLMLDGRKTSLLGAVFANSIISDNIDWEDCSWTGHPSAGLVPAALALAEARGKSGKDFLTAIIAGFEVYQRIAMVIQPPRGFKANIGWGLTSWQIFASCAPAAKMMDLTAEQYEQALGIAAVLMAVPNSLVHFTMSNIYHYQHGFCAQDGVLSAMLAEHGVDGMTGAFDGENGFGQHHLVSAQEIEWYQKDLGTRYLIMDTLLKHWPTNMWVQASLDIMDAFMKEDGITADDIDEIIVDPPTQMRVLRAMRKSSRLSTAFPTVLQPCCWIPPPAPSGTPPNGCTTPNCWLWPARSGLALLTSRIFRYPSTPSRTATLWTRPSLSSAKTVVY